MRIVRLRRVAQRVGAVVTGWSPEERDAILYAASGLFAIVTMQFSGIALYRQWGRIAVGPYLLAAAASAWLARSARRRAAGTGDGAGRLRPVAASDHAAHPGHLPWRRPDWHWTAPRMSIFMLVLVGATLLPLSLEVAWRSTSNSTSHVQPEVLVVEHSAHRLYDGKDPYQMINPKKPPPVPAGQPAYDAFDPYLPLMSVLGLARSTNAPPRLTDARVIFSIVTIAVVAVALALTRGPTGPRVLTLQAMTVLPTAGLPLATGGDDLPVVAIMLLGLVLVQRRRPLLAGLTMGVVASMKFTAWPLAVLALLVVQDATGQRSRRSRLSYLGGLVAVMVPAVLPSVLANVPAFVENVVRFPLGLAGVRSPAATPLLGHLVVAAFPGLHELFTVSLVVAGSVVLGWVLVRRTPRDPATLVRVLGWAVLAAILLAPTTRVGYLLYPIDFFVWAWLMAGEQQATAAAAGEEPPGPGEQPLVRGPQRLAS